MKQIIRRVAALVVGLGLGAIALAGLESVTHISDLNASWPLGSDLASTSDDHIRNIKSALKTDFPNVNGAVNPTPAQFNQLTSNTFTSAVTGNSFIPSSSTVPSNGTYLPAANTIGWSTNTTARGSVNSTGNWTINAPSSGTALTVTGLTAGSTAQMGISGATNNPYIAIKQIEASGSVIDANGSTLAGSVLNVATAGTNRLQIGSSGNVTVNAPSSGSSLTVSGVSNTYVASLEYPVSGSSGGLLRFQDTTNSLTRGYIGSGNTLFNGGSAADFGIAATNGSIRLSKDNGVSTSLMISTGGNLTVSAPSSGVAAQVNSVASAYALQLNSAGAANFSGIQFNLGGTNKGFLGSVGTAGDFFSGSAQNDFAVSSQGGAVSLSADGANSGLRITASNAAIQGRGPVAAALVDMTPDTSTFTATVNAGCTTTPTVTARWYRIGNQVSVNYPTVTCTSNAGTFTINGAPAAISPATSCGFWFPVGVAEDNTAGTSAYGCMSSSGQMTLRKASAGFGSNWTPSGTKGIGDGTNGIVVTYNLY